MPTVFIVRGFRFFFFSNEGAEPMHVHIEKAEKYAKFWLNPVRLDRNYKFSSSELRKIREIVQRRKEEIEEKWNEYFRVS
ncbi:MAG: DUF4160 domain-containing protein [Candidatus Omnitrophica bacterium]|nr:DUF4160 domain-containing protein [Candidatus Omnitrophota bacterium]